MSNIENRKDEYKKKNDAVYNHNMEQMAAMFDETIKTSGGCDFIRFCSAETLRYLKQMIDGELDKRGEKAGEEFFGKKLILPR